MPAGRLQVPDLVLVHKAYPKALGYTMLLYQHPEPLHPLAGRVDVGQHDVKHAVLCQPLGHQRIRRQRLRAAENALRGTHAHAGRVEPCAPPVPRQMKWRQGTVTQEFPRKVTLERTIHRLKARRAKLVVLIELKILGNHRVPVFRPRKQK